MARAKKTRRHTTRPDLEKPLSFHGLSPDQLVDDLLAIPPSPRPAKPPKKTAKRRKKKR
jgi:hypothetical protein